MNSEAWVAVAAILATLLVTLVNLFFTRSAQVRQIDAERQRSLTTIALEARRAHEQRLWDARAKVYGEYLGWLQGSVREILRDPDRRLLKEKLGGGWWKTPYDLRTSMLLFESDAVRAERGVLAECLSAIALVLDVGPGRRSAKARYDCRPTTRVRRGARSG
ncbi:hypothetical protein ACI2LF_07875 [Kribbella sp. NPDC020789]